MTIDENPVPNSVNLNSLVSVVVLPELSQPEMAIEPTHKVLPEYSLSARQANQTGEITLSYHIDTNGNIENITIVATNVSRALQRSAKKALAQWRYPPNKQLSGQHQVVFKFALAEQ
jgi:TonB family protein